MVLGMETMKPRKDEGRIGQWLAGGNVERLSYLGCIKFKDGESARLKSAQVIEWIEGRDLSKSIMRRRGRWRSIWFIGASGASGTDGDMLIRNRNRTWRRRTGTGFEGERRGDG